MHSKVAFPLHHPRLADVRYDDTLAMPLAQKQEVSVNQEVDENRKHYMARQHSGNQRHHHGTSCAAATNGPWCFLSAADYR